MGCTADKRISFKRIHTSIRDRQTGAARRGGREKNVSLDAETPSTLGNSS